MNVNTIKMMEITMAIFFAVNGAGLADNAGARTKEAQAAISPDQALEMLKQGNQRFVNSSPLARNILEQVKQTANDQYPFAVIVSCLDSRIPPEIVFDQGIGDLFVARIAGNFVDDNILGSLEFATKLSGAKLIVIMGHTECGAVKGVCDETQLGLLTATLANINPAVAAVQDDFSPRNSTNPAFVQAVSEKNVMLTMQKLRDRSIVMREMLDKCEIAMVGAMYDIRTGKVTFFK